MSGHRPDQAGFAAAADLRVFTLGMTHPKIQRPADVAYVRFAGGGGTDHQQIHFLIVGVTLQQIGAFGAQQCTGQRVWLEAQQPLRVILVRLEFRLVLQAESRKIEQVHLFEQRFLWR